MGSSGRSTMEWFTSKESVPPRAFEGAWLES